MKFMILFLASALGGGTVASAQIINVQIDISGYETYTGAGADPLVTAPAEWNQVTGSGTVSGLLDATDSPTTAAFTIATPSGEYQNGYYRQTAPHASSVSLFNGYAFTENASNISFEISGLTADAGQSFTLYLYGQNGNNSGSTNAALFTLTNDGGDSATASGNDGGSGDFAPGLQYVVLSGLIGSDGTIQGTVGWGPVLLKPILMVFNLT